MSAIAAININSALVGDQAVQILSALTNSTTVASDGTLDPEGGIYPPGVSVWVDRRGGIPIAYPKFSFSLRPPVKGSPVYRSIAKFDYPVLESNLGPAANGVTPGPTQAYVNSWKQEVAISARATAADRRVFLSYIISLMVRQLMANDLAPTSTTGSPIPSAVLDLSGVWGA